MKFVFEGMYNIDKKLLKRITHKYILQNGGRDVFKQARDWILYIRPDHQAHTNPHFYGQNGVGGVTGLGKIDMYLRDIKGNLTEMSNWVALTHELAHMILIIMNIGYRTPLRNEDRTGTPKGTRLKYWTAEVHDRDIEGRYYTEKIFTFPRWYKFRALDFRDHKK